jgi:hypothetical protein
MCLVPREPVFQNPEPLGGLYQTPLHLQTTPRALSLNFLTPKRPLAPPVIIVLPNVLLSLYLRNEEDKGLGGGVKVQNIKQRGVVR